MHDVFSRRLKPPAGTLALHDCHQLVSQLCTEMNDCRIMLKAHRICVMHQI